MKCFYHPDVDAVGMCKHCARGVCHACAAEREGGLACANRHEAIVDSVSALVSRNVKVTTGVIKTSWLPLLIFWGGAIACAYLVFQEKFPTMRILLLIMTATLFACGLGSARVFFTRFNKK